LSVHEVGNGDWVVALDVGNHALEHGVGMGFLGSDSHIFLAEMLELGLNGNRLLEAEISK
jgi:hypothetical protein